MAIGWKDPSPQQKKDVADFPSAVVSAPPSGDRDPLHSSSAPTSLGAVESTPRASAVAALKESVIAADLAIEGKIEGTGHVRIAGRFKGDVNVKGDLTIEQGAKLNGSVRADKVTVAGELEGNIESANRVELQQTCAMNGDIKAQTLTIAAGSRVRGHVECGWEGSGAAAKPANDAVRGANSSAA